MKVRNGNTREIKYTAVKKKILLGTFPEDSYESEPPEILP